VRQSQVTTFTCKMSVVSTFAVSFSLYVPTASLSLSVFVCIPVPVRCACSCRLLCLHMHIRVPCYTSMQVGSVRVHLRCSMG